MNLRKFREQLDLIPEKFWDQIEVVAGDTRPGVEYEYGGAFQFQEITEVEVTVEVSPKLVLWYRPRNNRPAERRMR